VESFLGGEANSAASLAGSISPMMSANLVPGDSRSAYRSSLGHQAIGISLSECSATNRLATAVIV